MENFDTVIVTGACGHIGSRLIDSFHWEDTYPEKFNVNIIGVDNMLTQRYCSIFNLKSRIKFIEDDFMNIDIPAGSIVVHLAAITDAAGSIKNKSQVEDINIEQTKRFIDKCIESKVKRFIFPSSTSVYGVSADLVNEDDERYENPQSPYASSKLDIEKYLESKKDNLEYIILRFGTIFGCSKGMRFHTAINKFCWQASLGVPITVWEENYEHVRPYLGLNDAVRAIKHSLKLDSSLCYTKYNVLTGNYQLKEIVDKIVHTLPDTKISMVHTPLLNQFSYHVDDRKFKSTGFESSDKLDIEIIKTLNLLKGIQ